MTKNKRWANKWAYLFWVVAIICLTTFHWLHADREIWADAFSEPTNSNTSISLSNGAHKDRKLHVVSSRFFTLSKIFDDNDDTDVVDNEIICVLTIDSNVAMTRRETPGSRPWAKPIILKLQRKKNSISKVREIRSYELIQVVIYQSFKNMANFLRVSI